MTEEDTDGSGSHHSAEPVNTNRYHARWHRALRFLAQRMLLRPVVSSVTRTTVEGAENACGLRGPFVLVANHCSHLDTAVMISRLPYRVTGSLAVGAAADHFYRHWWIKAATSLFFNTYPIRRSGAGSGDRGVSLQLLREGLPILLFPEGTRARDGRMGDFTPGPAKLVITTETACLPVALIGTHEAMPVGRFWPVFGRPEVRVLVGAPMHPHPEERAPEFNARIVARVRTMIADDAPSAVDDEPEHDRRGRDGEEAA